ncbi:putative peptidase m20 [Botryosphaeria dothidea]|uniref:Peptidase M20 domain-containing protein 2 n=1 Tax=Botryosphaeria dothidea TaxID=55169 RepID=A0A8H4N2Q8_9PEZI|nr:putative peptidase m20 [Botryosphaeria dothidea]KAF4304948.1 putative peptidase m20 [Botryosphaeria dothidea]
MDDDWVLVSPDYLGEIGSYIDTIADSLWPINKKIHDNPELGYKEYIAHEALTSFLKKQDGWKVTPSAYGMETAFVAVFDSGKKGPVVSFNAEMDALEEIGHACGHNLIATASLSGALAAAETMRKHNLPGKIVLFGTPAEEGGGGKIKLINAGAYRDHACDVNLISHPGITSDCALMRTSAYRGFTVEYFGREAHAAASPWLGINALDALITAYTALSVLRQQTRPGDVVQGNITHGGLRPNIIHAYAAGEFVVRADTRRGCDELFARARKCFEAGALGSGAKLAIADTGAYADHVPNRTLAALYRAHFNALGGKIPAPEVDEVRGRTMASTDQGDVSYVVPSLSAGFWVRPGEQGNGPHSPDFAGATGTREAFGLALRCGKGLAGTAVDLLVTEGLVEEVKREFEREVKGKA